MNLSETLVVGISSTALFDLHIIDETFWELVTEKPEETIVQYRELMLEREDQALDPGTGMPLVKALLNLNKFQKGSDKEPLVEVVVMSRNSPETGVLVLNNIRKQGLQITRHAFTGGESVTDYLEAFDVDLFLTTSKIDAQRVIDTGFCPAAILQKPPSSPINAGYDEVRIAFDGDAVLFDESSELVYKTEGLDAFSQNEDENQHVPMPDGPYASFIRKLSVLQNKLPGRIEYSPVRLAIVTARNEPAGMRVIKTLRHWDVYVDALFLTGGVDKSKILKAFKPHIFFDDQELHIDRAAKNVPSGRVPYPSDSPLNNLQTKK